MKTGATAGAFDLFHREHKKLIDECRAGCDRLVVFLEDDELVRSRRRPPPALDFNTRERALLAYGVDEVGRLKSWVAPSEESLFEVPIPRNARELVDANYPGWECDFSVWRSYKPSKFDVNF